MNLELRYKIKNNHLEVLKLALKCMVFAVVVCFFSMLCHVVDSAFIQDVHGKPEFVKTTLLIYSMGEKVLLAVGYVVLGYKIPLVNNRLRGFTYIMLVWASNFLPQIMGLGGADGPIAAMAFSLSTVVCDSLSYVMAGLLIGELFKKRFIKPRRSCNKVAYSKTIILSAIGFPLLVILGDQIMERLYAPFASAAAMGVSDEKRMSFYITFYSWFVLSGALIAVFYRVTEYNEGDNKGWLRFAIKYIFLLWAPIVLIMIVFGTEIMPTVVYTLLFAIYILVICWVNGKLLDNPS